MGVVYVYNESVFELFSQDYIDSMEGATLSGRQCAYEIIKDVPSLKKSAEALKAVAA